jgi:hypothetical protein
VKILKTAKIGDSEYCGGDIKGVSVDGRIGPVRGFWPVF